MPSSNGRKMLLIVDGSKKRCGGQPQESLHIVPVLSSYFCLDAKCLIRMAETFADGSSNGKKGWTLVALHIRSKVHILQWIQHVMKTTRPMLHLESIYVHTQVMLSQWLFKVRVNPKDHPSAEVCPCGLLGWCAKFIEYRSFHESFSIF